MPCYDKKLEASREDFYNDIYKTRDVDCVISSRKLLVSIINHSKFRRKTTTTTKEKQGSPMVGG